MSLFNTRIKSTFVTATVVMATSLLFLAGCMSFNPKSMRSLDTTLMASNPGLDIASSTKFGIGSLTLDFVDFAFVHDRSIDLSKISRAEIGVYELGKTLVVNDFTLPQEVTADWSCPRREVIMRVREEDEHMQVVVCIRNDKITGLAVFVLEPREIVVINVRGDFEAIVNSLVKASVKKKSREAEVQASISHKPFPTVANQTADSKGPRS